MNNLGGDAGDRKDQSPSDVNGTPTDINDDVRADLEAAFAHDSARLRIKDEPTQGLVAPRHDAGDRDAGDHDAGDHDAGVSNGDEPAQPGVAPRDEKSRGRKFFGSRQRRRRSILEIAHDYDTRIKAQADAAKFGHAGYSAGSSAGSSASSSAGSPAKTERENSVAKISDTAAEVAPDTARVLEALVVEPDDADVGIDGKKRVVITDDTIDIDQKALARRHAPRRRKRRFWSRNRTEQDDELSRLRKQRRASHRIDGRWRPRWYMVVGGVVTLFIGALLLLTSPLLSINQIDIEGNVYADSNALAAVINNLDGDPILTADLHGAKVQIEAIPWVRKARVTMHLPSRILIQVDERSPLAFVRSVDGFNRVLDRDGRVLDVLEGDPVEFIRIIGTAPSLIAGDFVAQPFLGTAQLINALPRELADRLVSATVSPEGEISLQFSPNLQVIFGNPADYQAKLVGVINEIKRQGTKSYSVIDVSSGEPNVR